MWILILVMSFGSMTVEFMGRQGFAEKAEHPF